MSKKNGELFPSLKITIDQLIGEFGEIPNDRKESLNALTRFVVEKSKLNQIVFLNFICTHNSRRSHIAQIWAQAVTYYFNISKVICFSGGTEATAFNPRAVAAMKDAGFSISRIKEGDNPIYEARFSTQAPPVISFSKKYDDLFNHCDNFAAIMTCSHADQNCPIVFGASARIAITYEDPKDFDNTAQEKAKYNERVRQIGREMLFVFSNVKNQMTE